MAVLEKTYSLPRELQLKSGLPATDAHSPAPPPYSDKQQQLTIDLSTDEGQEMENASLGRVAALEEALRLVHLEKVRRL